MPDWIGLDWLRRRADEPLVVQLPGGPLPLALRRLKQARRLTLRLAPDGSEARVSMPVWGRTADALAFAEARAGWLATQLAQRQRALPPGPGGTLALRGAMMRIVWDRALPRRPVVVEDELRLGGAAEGLGPRLQRWLMAEARADLAADLECYCARAGVALPGLALSSAQRRWGSCSAGPGGRARVVRINWRLVMAPAAVRRSVVAHEVAHLLHFDHSPAFHAALGALFEGDLGSANLWLKRHGRTLYAAFG